MCRFTFYRGETLRISDLVTEPDNSLIRQSYAARERKEPLNGDGFGLAWYVPGQTEPGTFRSITPAWSNQNLHSLARVVESGCILAHVRAASPGLEVVETNCHPFTHGRFAFMHNGELGAFRRVRRPLLASLGDEAFHRIRGTTDSEHLFALFLEEMEREEGEGGCGAMAAALDRAVARALRVVEEHGEGAPSRLNLAVTDGAAAVVCRFASDAPPRPESLYVARVESYRCEDGVCRMEEIREGRESPRAILVCSEPLTDDVHWEAVPVNHRVSIHESLDVEVGEVEIGKVPA